MNDLRSVFRFAPELMLFVTAILTLSTDIVSRHQKSSQRLKLITGVSILGLLISLLLALRTIAMGSTEVFERSYLIDPVSQFFKLLLIFSGIITVLQACMSKEIRKNEKAEIYTLLILGTLGMCAMTSAVHLLLLFLAYETVGLACYVLAAFKRGSAISSEAGIKIFVHGALTSVLFAFGIVMLYGIGKSFNILDIRTQLASTLVPTSYLWVAFGLIFVALAARMAVFPFHFLMPDVVEGSPSPASSFFSVSSNIAAIAFAIRLCIHIFSVKGDLKWAHLNGFQWPELITGVAATSMTIGNLTALYQNNLKRLIGYSSIAQMGYLLMGLAVSNRMGISSVLFSLTTYGVVTLGTFFVIQMVTDAAGNEDISILKGLVWRNPYEGVVLCIFLLSLAGLPPLMGFIGHVYVLGAVMKEKIYWLAIVGAMNYVVGLTYCLSMIRRVFATNPTNQDGERAAMSANPIAHGVLAVLLFPTLLLGVYWDPLMNYITHSLESVMW